MASNQPDFRSMSGQAETAEPVGNPQAAAPAPTSSTSTSTSSTRDRRSASANRQPGCSSTSNTAPPLRKQTSNSLLPHSNSPSAGASPKSSRNTSPVRKDSRPGPLQPPNFSTQPSAAAIQRALSASNVPQLQGQGGAVTEAVSKLPGRGSQRGSGAGLSGETTPQWPISPRLKSPPPSASNSRRGSATATKKTEGQSNSAPPSAVPPSINVSGATPTSNTTPPQTPAKQSATDAGKEEKVTLQAPPPPKMPSRGPSGKSTLATVQENSTDSTVEPSAAASKASADLKPLSKVVEEDKITTPKRNGFEDLEKHSKPGESGSESGGNKSEGKRSRRQSLSQSSTSQQQKPKSAPPTKTGFPALTSTKSRQPEGTRNMTVETETVQSIPQSALNAGDRSGGLRGENSGSVRLKPSNETIRPKKERKKPSQKARSINQGTGTYNRSPLLLQRGSLDDMNGSTTCVSSTASQSGESRPGSPQRQQQPMMRSYSQQVRSAFNSTFNRHPSLFFGGSGRVASNRNLRKASSKADIFEARVANAVDEANSSDSDETFVYESNPPEPQRRPRHHSRTPSVTSSHSAADQRAGVRNFNDILDERRVAGKRSMKFSNNPFNEMDSPNDRQDGTVRSHQPRHYGRWGRGGSHASMFDQDSPFTQASKLRNSTTNLRHSRPSSPRSPQSIQNNRPTAPTLFGGRKKGASFDFDGGEGADDERTPLVGTVRTSRSGRYGGSRIHSSGAPSIDEYYGVRRQPRCGRFSGCLLGAVVFITALAFAMIFLFMSNRPLYDVHIHKIENVLASEQEIMLDLRVGAVNPNALGISITDMDVNIFAKSKHIGGNFHRRISDTLLPSPQPAARRNRIQTSSFRPPWQPAPPDHRDDGTDPDPDPEDSDSQTMLLGRIFHFDQSLAFEGSPIKRHPHFSTGELRLAHPGNKTEAGGSQRWEEVLKHPFELIVRGVLTYQLPISGRGMNSAVGGSVVVHPEDVDGMGNLRLEAVQKVKGWEWIEWEDEKPRPVSGGKGRSEYNDWDGERVVEVQ